MPFSISGAVITQTGTDADLSGLSGIAGVTTSNRLAHTEYDIGANRLVITGDLTIAAAGTREQLAFRGDVDHDNVDISVEPGASLTLGTFQANPLDYEFQHFVPAIQEDIDPNAIGFGVTNGFLSDGEGQPGRRASLWVQGGSTFSCYARTWNVASFGTGETAVVEILSSQFTFHASAYMYGPTVTIVDCTYDTFSFVSPIGYDNISNNRLTRGGLFTISSSTPATATYVISNIPDLNGIELVNSGTNNASLATATNIAVNLETGTDQTYSVLASREWDIFLRREIGFTALDAGGTPLEDTRVFYQGAVGTETVVDVDSAGRFEFTFEFATRQAIGGTIQPYTFFTKNGDETEDLIDVRAIEYSSAILNNLDVSLRGLERLELGLSLLPDFDITESDRSVVDAYTTIDTAEQLYDVAKAFLVDNYAGEDETFISRTGNMIDAGALDVVIDSTAPGVFDFDGSTITMRSSAFLGQSITTTGSITVADGTDIGGSSFSSLNLTSGRDLIGVSVSGDLTFNDNTAGTFDLTDSTIGTLANDGTAVLSFNETNSMVSDASDAEIVVMPAPTPSSIDLAASGANWAIYDDTGTRVNNGTGDIAFTNAAAVDTGTWTIVVHQPGSFAEIFTWTSDDGSENNFVYSDAMLVRPEGGSAYSNSAPADVIVLVNGDNLLEVNLPNRTVDPQGVIDSQQDFLSTLDGLDFIHDTGIVDAPVFGTLNGNTFLLSVQGYQYDSIPGVTPSSALGAILISSSTHPAIRPDNGSFAVLQATDTQAEVIAALTNAGLIELDPDATNQRFTMNSLELAPSGGGSSDATLANQTAILTAIDDLNDLSSADVTAAVPSTAQIEAALLDEGDGQQLIDAIAIAIGNTNVDEVALVAAIRADIERAGGAIDSLNDFDPAVDVVANVTLVDTTTTNTDMRGTDGANTVAPDNAGIASNATAIASLSTALTALGTDVTDILADTNELQSDDIPSLITALPDAASITALQDVLDLLRRYHDNRTAYFAEDGTTEVPQMEAFFVVVYEDDDVTELKRIALRDASSTPTVLPDSTRYERI